VGVTTLISIHDVNLAVEYCDHIVVLQEGRVRAAGATETVLVPEVLEPVFGVKVERLPRAVGRDLYWFRSLARPSVAASTGPASTASGVQGSDLQGDVP
jgi:iron complex transport system ATP-binding protein